MAAAFDLGTRFHQYIAGHDSNPSLWRHALRDSLNRLNERTWTDILDIGGGTGALEGIIGGDARYWLVDKCAGQVGSRDGPRRFQGDAEALPFADASFDLVISISTMQYLDHAAFFRECSRVLRPGGLLAIHENGGRNPVIRFGRTVQRRAARSSASLQRYLDTIRDYYVPSAGPRPELRCIYAKSYFLLSPASFALATKGYSRLASFTEMVTVPIDEILMRLPGAKSWAWWNVQHFLMLEPASEMGGSTADRLLYE